MSIEIVEVNTVKRNLVAEIAAEEVEGLIEDLAQKYARKAKVPGFRPGKVPLSVIRQRFASELRREATEELIHRSWHKAAQEYDLKPLDEPVVEKVDFEPGKPMNFTLGFEVLPNLEVKDYKEVPVTMTESSLEDAQVDRAMEALRERSAQFVPVDDGEVKDGNLLTVTLDGEFEGGGKPLHEENVTLVVAAPETHESFTENLRGAHVGETPSFDVVYSENYHQKRFAGKTVHYRVEIKDIKEKQVPDLNDDFARDLGAESLDQLRTRTRDELITQARKIAEEKARAAALDEVVRRQSFDVPEALVHRELELHARRIAANLAQRGIDVHKTSIDWAEVFKEEQPQAMETVRRRLVLDAIARQEHLEVTEEELDAEFQKLGQIVGKSGPALRAQFEKDQRLQEVRVHLLQNKALDFVYRNANISKG